MSPKSLNRLEWICMNAPGLANLSIGLYKGVMNASGQDVDTTLLLYTLGGTSAARSVTAGAFIHLKNQDTDPQRAPHKIHNPLSGAAKAGINSTMHGACETALGYCIGYAIQKVFF
ncbi:hypothetical protein ACFL0V_04300 [Nanoarchaeota archaeon]